jgi:uncharacterized SAM-binding protein YcdF (DUF218 family)
MLKSFFIFFLDPYHVFLLLVLAAAGAGWFRKDVWFRISTVAAICWLLITSTGLIPGWMLKSLEYRYLPAEESTFSELRVRENVQIVVLGAGHGYYESHPANVLLVPAALSRLAEGIRIHKSIPGSRIIVSGYSAVGGVTSAGMKEKAALLLGVEEEDIMVHNEPVNTFEEALLFREKFDTANPILLVTSAAHMPRAVMLFEKCGVKVIPSPSHYRIMNPDKFPSMIPSITHMVWFKTALYEYAAMFRDRLRPC